MGIDFLEFTFRIEAAFDIKVPPGSVSRLPQRSPFDLTAGELPVWVVALCGEQGLAVRPSSWNRVKLALAKTTGKSPRLIRQQTWIVRDLGFS